MVLLSTFTLPRGKSLRVNKPTFLTSPSFFGMSLPVRASSEVVEVLEALGDRGRRIVEYVRRIVEYLESTGVKYDALLDIYLDFEDPEWVEVVLVIKVLADVDIAYGVCSKIDEIYNSIVSDEDFDWFDVHCS